MNVRQLAQKFYSSTKLILMVMTKKLISIICGMSRDIPHQTLSTVLVWVETTMLLFYSFHFFIVRFARFACLRVSQKALISL